MAKASIKAVTASKELTPDQLQILRRVGMVLKEHGFSIEIKTTKKVTESINLKIKRA